MKHLDAQNLSNFSNASILVVGDVMLDRYWFGDTERISPEAPVPIVKINGNDHRPGGAGNVALNIASLDAKVTLLGIIGQDEAAETLDKQLAAAGVSHELIMSANVSTIIKLRIISKRQQLLRLDFEDKLSAELQTPLLKHYQTHLPKAKCVVLSDYQKGTLINPLPFIELANRAGIPIIIDPKGSDFTHYKNASIITPNFKEFEAVVGRCENERSIIEKARMLIETLHLNALLITRGAAGMTLIDGEQTMHLSAYAREILDVTGAGDTVISTLATAYAAGMSLSQATMLSNLAASIIVGKLGAATVTTPELEAALSGKTSFSTGILNEEQLLAAKKEAHALGKKIVFTNGCFDILHAGHVMCLKMAKALGDYLIVAVNDDASIHQMKGPSRPINNLEHRMAVLASLGVVDWVVPFNDDTPERLLKIIQPDILVKGSDYLLHQVVGADIVRAYGGEVRIVDSKITSSSAIINRIIEGHHTTIGEQPQHG